MITNKFINTLAALLLSLPVMSAQAVEPNGCYQMDGPLAINVKIPQIVTLAVSTPHMKVAGVNFRFNPDRSFVMDLPLLGALNLGLPTELKGNWQMKGTRKFVIETELATLIQQLHDQGIEAHIVKKGFSGKLVTAAGDKINGAFTLKVNIALQKIGTASFSLQGTYNGKWLGATCASSVQSFYPGTELPLSDFATWGPYPEMGMFVEELLKDSAGFDGKVAPETAIKSLREYRNINQR